MLRLSPGHLRFLRYAAVGVSTLAFDLLLLSLLVEQAHVPYYLGTPLAFLIAVSINYALSRRLVFRGTERALHTGYLYFILLAGGGALVITVLVAGAGAVRASGIPCGPRAGSGVVVSGITFSICS